MSRASTMWIRKSIKTVIALLLVFFLYFPGLNSPSFFPFPCPYPTNRAEVIADLIYQIQEDSCPNIILSDLLESWPQYKIGKIFKVKNRFGRLAGKYTWLIMIMEQDGKIAMRVALMESGLMAMCGGIGEDYLKSLPLIKRMELERFLKVIEEEDIKNILSESLGRLIGDNEIKKMERVAYPSVLGELLRPIWEIRMADGTIYYYSENRDMVYSIDKKLSWKKVKERIRPYQFTFPYDDYLIDTINDELVLLDKIPRKR